MGIALKLCYYPWITQYIPPEEIYKQIGVLAQETGKELSSLLGESANIEVLKPVEVPEQIRMIVARECNIALMNPLGYVFANSRNKSVRAQVVALREIDGKVGSTYFAQLYARADSGLADVSQLGNTSIGFGTSYSTSNFLMPAVLLKRHAFHPLTRFSRTEFLGGHDKVAMAVYKRKVDVGAGHDGVIADLARQTGYEDAATALKTIIKTELIPSDPIAVNVESDSLRAFINKALVTVSTLDSVKVALEQFWGKTKGLAFIEPSEYDVFSKALTELSLSERDCLGK